MENNAIRIILFGNSLILSGIEVVLDSDPRYSVVLFTDNLNGCWQIPELKPDILVFDQNSPEAQSIPSLIGLYPDLAFIGLDIPANKAVSLRSEQFNLVTASDLTQILADAQTHR